MTLELWYAYSGLSAFVSVSIAMYPLLNRLFSPKVNFPKLTIDVRKISPGKVLITSLNGSPIFIRNRTYNQIKSVRAVKLNVFKDKSARNANLSNEALAFDVNRCVNRNNQNLLVVMASCPHLGCVPSATPDGWICSCHGSRFDLSGRIIDGPSPLNMRVPKCSIKTYHLSLEL
ncbi:MAG: ubiquinol-cytochrome c reductase iron-sulfur subunit [Candidatus Hodgkinia cicadicola]